MTHSLSRSEISYVAVDWGTSSFRLWVIGKTGAILAERRAPEGMSTLSGAEAFAATLQGHLGAVDLSADESNPLRVVACGMVGARQGWKEVPYAPLPADLDALAIHALAMDVPGLDFHILPGLSRTNPERPDVMRGEETQLMGLGDRGPALVCMPGTHSKWVRLEGRRVMDFSSVMTGELFALFSTQSLLRHTIGGAKPSGDVHSAEFQKGLEIALQAENALLSHLFSIRASGLIHGLAGAEAADRLSGLLIGSEIAHGLKVNRPASPVVLVASGAFARLYGAAFEAAGATFELVDADEVVRLGLAEAAGQLWPVHAAGGQ